MIEVAAFACIGVGVLLNISSRDAKLKAEDINRATCIQDLKGLGNFLESKPLNRTVVVFGVVGSDSTVENNRSGGLGVFVEETATICFERKGDDDDTIKEYRRKVMLNRKEVPWYLDDGTARVKVMEIQYARGFSDALNNYYFNEAVTEHFESLFFMKGVEIYPPSCCEHVLEIGTPLTVVGRVEKDEDGTPMIGRAYEVFEGQKFADELVSDLKSNASYFGEFSWFLTAVGITIVLVPVLRDIKRRD